VAGEEDQQLLVLHGFVVGLWGELPGKGEIARLRQVITITSGGGTVENGGETAGFAGAAARSTSSVLLVHSTSDIRLSFAARTTRENAEGSMLGPPSGGPCFSHLTRPFRGMIEIAPARQL
jgi:hypothetical protein